jgi:hypothetical protein
MQMRYRILAVRVNFRQRTGRASDIDVQLLAAGKPAHNYRKKSIIAALTSDARSCWVQ